MYHNGIKRLASSPNIQPESI